MPIFSDWLEVHPKKAQTHTQWAMLQVIPDYEGNPLDLPQFTAKSGRGVASYQHVEDWILSHVPWDSFSKIQRLAEVLHFFLSLLLSLLFGPLFTHGGCTSNHVECINSCMSRGGNKNVNMCSGRSQATTCWGVLNKKVYGDSWEQRAEALPRVQSPLTQAI